MTKEPAKDSLADSRKMNVVSLLLAGAALAALALLAIWDPSRYPLFHSIADMVAVFVAGSVFLVVWNGRRHLDNNYYLFIAIAFLSFAFLDFMHIMGNKGMGVFPQYGNLGPTFYVASRYVLGISFLLAPLFIKRKMSPVPIFAIHLLVVATVLLSVLYWRNFPATYVEGVGLTPFKVYSDYAVCVLLLGGLALLLVNRRAFDPRVLKIIALSLVLSIATGLSFTLYADPFGIMNAVGHVLQIASFYLVYLGFIETALTNPQNILYRALHDSEQRLQMALQVSRSFAFEWDVATDRVVRSESCAGILGVVGEEIQHDTAQRYIKRVDPEDRKHFTATLEHLRPNADSYTMQYRVIRSDGSVAVLEEMARGFFDADGKLYRLVGTTTDITRRKHAEEELKAAKLSAEHAKTAAEQASRAKDHFLAVLSHELRTPLAPVVATLSALRDDPRFDDDAREDLEIIRRNVELEVRLIDDLLDVTRIERGKVELDRQVTDLRDILRLAIDVCMPDIEAKNLEFSIIPMDQPYLVNVDAARLQQVVWNLLKNAIKFTPGGGRISVSCRRLDNHVVVEINDSGLGIEPEVLPRVFNAFEQGDIRITRQFGGLGLGLAISKAIVDLHGGALSARSEGKGKGATFAIRLPLVKEPAICPSASSVPLPLSPASAARPVRILLVEDHADTARVMHRLLSANGHTVQLAPNVATALELASAQPFDLMLSDLGLPDGSGLDLVKAMRAKGSDVPAIALSGYGTEHDLQRSLDAGFSMHLTKPISLPKLTEAISQVARTQTR